MRVVLEAGTDIATLCFFDPAALPADFARLKSKARVQAIDGLERQGRVFRLRTGADGSSTVHVHVDEPAPAVKGKVLATGRAHTSSGCFRLTGEEDIGNGASNRIDTPASDYQFTAWMRSSQDIERDLADQDRVLMAYLDPAERASYQQGNRWGLILLAVIFLAGTFCLGASLLKSGRAFFGWQGLLTLWGGWLVLFLVVPRLLDNPRANAIARRRLEAVRETAQIVIQLTRV